MPERQTGLNARHFFFKMEEKRLEEQCPVFHAIMSIKINDYYFPGTKVCCTGGINETLKVVMREILVIVCCIGGDNSTLVKIQ